MSKALLLIDIQRDFFPGGAMPLVGSLDAGHNAGKLLECFRARHYPVVHIQHFSGKADINYLLPYTGGAALHASVLPALGEIVFQKTQPDSFRGTFLADYLHAIGVDELIIAGMMTFLCIDATLHSANTLGFKCTLAHDACTSNAVKFGDIEVPGDKVHDAYIDMVDRYTLTRVCSTKSLCSQLSDKITR